MRPDEEAGAAPGGAKRFSILLVDDRADNLVALEAALSDLGQDIVKARSGKEALRHLLERDFVVILLDVNMPEMDGYETASMIRQRRKSAGTPIIFVTAAMGTEVHLSRGYALGAVDFLFTPIEPEILRAKVAAFIDLARKAEQARTRVESERAAAERRAAVLESRLQSLFNRLDVGIFRATLDGELLEANPALLRLLGLGSLEDARNPDTWPGDDSSRQQLLSYLVNDQPLQEQVVELAGADGTRAWVSVTKTLSAGPDGESFVEGLVTDITRRRRTEEEREQLLASERAARDAAELANRIKDEFLATVSHELRTPLHAIVGWAEVLRHPKMNPEDLRLGIESIKRNTEVQTRLIDDLLDMSRIMSGKIRLDVQRVTLETVIEHVILSCQPSLEAKGIRLVKQFDPECPVVAGDAGRLQQVVWNLFSNAIKFTPGKGTVTVEVKGAGESVHLCVSDDGQGIRPEFLPHLFGRFRQADATSTRRHGGLGLGLAIVKHLVEMHGGTVSAHSEGVGKGARFDVLLPVASATLRESVSVEPATNPGAVQSVDPQQKPELAGIRILVVDDVADARDLMRVVLEDCAAEVRTAESALQALEMIGQEMPDVLVSDIGMADFDGYYLMSQVRAMAPERGGGLPSVAITSFARPEDRARAIQAGFDEHLIKPIEPWRLIQTIAALSRRALESHRAKCAEP